VLQDISKGVKLTIIKQRLLAVLITLTPRRLNKFIDCRNANVRIAVLPIMEVKTLSNSTLEFLEGAYHLRVFMCKWLQTSKQSDYNPLFRTQDEWTILKFVMDVFKPF
jgi:hypothetical protein